VTSLLHWLRLQKSTVPLGTDVTLNPAARRIVVSCGLRRQPLASPPIPWGHELTGPQTPPRRLSGRLLASVNAAILAIGQRHPRQHHGGVEVDASGVTDGDDPAIAIPVPFGT
jgi:hypothetical protein